MRVRPQGHNPQAEKSMTKNRIAKNDDVYVQMGIAALLPGMVHAVELMQGQINEMKARLAALQDGAAEPARKVGRPRKGTTAGVTVASGWPADPEERKAEMRRRQAVAKKKAQSKARSERARKIAQRRWKNMTAEQRAEWQRKIEAGQRKAVEAKRAASAPKAVKAARKTAEGSPGSART